jgi:phosphate transport system permease protein
MSTQQVEQASTQGDKRRKEMQRAVRRIETSNGAGISLLWVVAAIVAVLFVGIIVYLIIQGAAYLFNPQFYGTGAAGVGSEIFNTFYILILAEVISLPIALAGAIYLIEYARQGPLVTVIHFAAETLASVPSIVLGLFGVLVFSIEFHLGTSRIAGALTLLCLNLPLALRLFEGALASVPREMREGGLALGATKWHVIRTVVVPSALPGIVTAIILTAGKIIGEAAALLFTMGLVNPPQVFTLNPLIASDTLATHLYYFAGPGAGSTGLTTAQEITITAGSSTLLILLLLIINVLARSLGRYIERRVTAA